MKIGASFNIPIGATIEVTDQDIAAARAAGVHVPEDNEDQDDDAWELANWLIRSYWSRAAGGYCLDDLVSDGEHSRDQPELIQIDDIDGVS